MYNKTQSSFAGNAACSLIADRLGNRRDFRIMSALIITLEGIITVLSVNLFEEYVIT